MKAITYSKYGSPDVLQLREVANPIPKDNEVITQTTTSPIPIWVTHYRSQEKTDFILFA